jgi:hypothetical protein
MPIDAPPKAQVPRKGIAKIAVYIRCSANGCTDPVPTKFQTPRAPLPLIQMLEGWLLKKTSKTLNPEICTEGSETVNPACRLLFFSTMQLLNKLSPFFLQKVAKATNSYRLLHSSQHAHR